MTTPWGPGVQNERTRLAWERTTLSGLSCSLLVARLLASSSLLLAVVVGSAAVLSSAVLGWFSTRRYDDNRAARQLAAGRTGRVTDGSAHAVVTALVLVTALGALVYLALV